MINPLLYFTPRYWRSARILMREWLKVCQSSPDGKGYPEARQRLQAEHLQRIHSK